MVGLTWLRDSQSEGTLPANKLWLMPRAWLQPRSGQQTAMPPRQATFGVPRYDKHRIPQPCGSYVAAVPHLSLAKPEHSLETWLGLERWWRNALLSSLWLSPGTLQSLQSTSLADSNHTMRSVDGSILGDFSHDSTLHGGVVPFWIPLEAQSDELRPLQDLCHVLFLPRTISFNLHR